MTDLPIKPMVNSLQDERVYGALIKEYEIGGVKADYSAAIALASLQQSEAIESLLPALNKTIDARQQKVSALGEALATLSEALASMDAKEQSTSKLSRIDEAKIKRMNEILAMYELEQVKTEKGQIPYGDTYRRQNTVQQALDVENNDLQQSLTLMQSLVQKRDNSFEVAHKVLAKTNRTAADTITSIGY